MPVPPVHSAMLQFGKLSRIQQNDADQLLEALRVVPETDREAIEFNIQGWDELALQGDRNGIHEEEQYALAITRGEMDASDDNRLAPLGHMRSLIRAVQDAPNYEPAEPFWRELVMLTRKQLDKSTRAISEHILTLVEEGKLHDASGYNADEEVAKPTETGFWV